MPVIYSSVQNSTLAYIWKILLNETAKVSAFCNTFPELTHNELEGVDEKQRTVLLVDGTESAGVKREMAVFLELASSRGWPVKEVSFNNSKTENLVKNWL